MPIVTAHNNVWPWPYRTSVCLLSAIHAFKLFSWFWKPKVQFIRVKKRRACTVFDDKILLSFATWNLFEAKYFQCCLHPEPNIYRIQLAQTMVYRFAFVFRNTFNFRLNLVSILHINWLCSAPSHLPYAFLILLRSDPITFHVHNLLSFVYLSHINQFMNTWLKITKNNLHAQR